MSRSVYLSVHEATGVEIRDVDALNAAFAEDGCIQELVEDYLGAAHPFLEYEGGEIRFLDREGSNEDEASYDSIVPVWGLFHLDQAQTIADHLDAGRIVLKLAPDGDDAQYLVIEPGRARMGIVTIV